MIVARDIEHAIELATQLAQEGADREIETGPVVEPWDLTSKPRPDGTPHRFLLLRKGDAAKPVPALLDAWKRDGVLQSATALAPSSQAARFRVALGKRTWTDGPFTESKELVAGFAIVDMPSLADVKAFAEEYAAILGDNEVDVRPIAGDAES
jgi:hypothetical protein